MLPSEDTNDLPLVKIFSGTLAVYAAVVLLYLFSLVIHEHDSPHPAEISLVGLN